MADIQIFNVLFIMSYDRNYEPNSGICHRQTCFLYQKEYRDFNTPHYWLRHMIDVNTLERHKYTQIVILGNIITSTELKTLIIPIKGYISTLKSNMTQDTILKDKIQ